MDLEYRSGRLAAKAFNSAFERMVRDDVRRVKHILEAREVPRIEGQPSAG